MKKNYSLILAGFMLVTGGAFGQSTEKCAAHSMYLEAKENDPSIALREAAFEALQLEQKNNIPAKGGVITVPIVFHIIHNGEPIGTGNNVSDALVMYQLQRINEDFRKMNADALPSSHPFYPVQADCEIEFCLATVDTNGNATSGITRHNLSATGWTKANIDAIVKPQTIWNRYDYINFWCVNIVDPSAPGVDGYATFPTATTDSTDGVVVTTNSFGYIDGTDKSITATHELGHYFNLFHIWGDATCGDDMVSDTPTAEQDNSGCPTFPHNVSSSCNPGPNGEMFMNFMDYSDAECVVMFTNGQKQRILSAINTFRSELLTSNGCASVSGISEVDFSKNFNLFPNPTNGSFTLDINKSDLTNVAMTIYNHLGQEVQLTSNITSFPLEVNLESLQGGVYFINLRNESNTTTIKVLLVD